MHTKHAALTILAVLFTIWPADGVQCGESAAPASLALPGGSSALSLPVLPGVSSAFIEAETAEELTRLRQEFREQVLKRTLKRLSSLRRASASERERKILDERVRRLLDVDPAYTDFMISDMLDRVSSAGVSLDESQYILYVDRNPARQTAMVAFFHAPTRTVVPIGIDLISTGNGRRGEDYFYTPTGVFENLVDNFGYRALGTPNSEGWLGLGAKGSRVWDFGFHKSNKIHKGNDLVLDIRLLVHSTDPRQGEKRLGRIDSKGCIRVSAGMNSFLDLRSILDKNYEEWARTKKDNWLLNKSRAPVLHPGRYLVVGDSAPGPEPASGTMAGAFSSVRIN